MWNAMFLRGFYSAINSKDRNLANSEISVYGIYIVLSNIENLNLKPCTQTQKSQIHEI